MGLDFFFFISFKCVNQIALFSSEEYFECLGFHDCHVPAHRPAVSNLSAEICKADKDRRGLSEPTYERKQSKQVRGCENIFP